jgi:hypothetical protein
MERAPPVHYKDFSGYPEGEYEYLDLFAVLLIAWICGFTVFRGAGGLIRRGTRQARRRTGLVGLGGGSFDGDLFCRRGPAQSSSPQSAWTPLVSRFGYSVGFLVVILGRQQLFTENTLTVILPLMHQKNLNTLMRVLRLWAVVLSANLFGTYLFAVCIGKIALFDPGMVQALTEIGRAHIGLAFGIVFVRAIFAGWLIALMVWLLPGPSRRE